MSFVKQQIWQDLLRTTLDTVPEGTRRARTRNHGLTSWSMHGAYNASRGSSKVYSVDASPIEVGEALLGDCEHLLDHAVEHEALLWNQLTHDEWFSPPWFVVTTYYWCFFSTMALTRLVGRTPVFVTGGFADRLKRLAGGAGPGPGSYELVLGAIGHSAADS